MESHKKIGFMLIAGCLLASFFILLHLLNSPGPVEIRTWVLWVWGIALAWFFTGLVSSSVICSKIGGSKPIVFWILLFCGFISLALVMMDHCFAVEKRDRRLVY